MGKVLSADTVYATAYLTEVGRKYLFQDEDNPRFVTLSDGTRIDRLKIERFSLGDPDVNYKLANFLGSGDLPDFSGENENSITGTKGRTLDNLISPSDAVLGDQDDVLEYSTSLEQIMFDLNKDLDKLPTIITQELITLINQEPTLESTYNLMPKNFGENKVKDNVLTINLQSATSSRPGYRMRIFYPTVEDNNNIVTIQFEKAQKITIPKKQFQAIKSSINISDLGV
jgi:hypothetical protein